MKPASKYLLVVGGPTASGKTTLAIKLAQHFDTEIISADSRQFYQEMKIGNARPDTEELSAVKHHLIADRSIMEPLNAGAFARKALVIVDQLFQQKDYAVVVGGSGLFIRALTEGLDDFPSIIDEIRQRVRALYEKEGLAALQLALSEADPEYYQKVDQRNPARLQRALEVCWCTGIPYSSYLKQQAQERNFTTIYLQSSWPRARLYERINQRVITMLAAGLEQEARQLINLQQLPALQTVGYQEWWPYFEGSSSKKEVINLIQQNSRRYAKRQLTWNRRDGYWKAIPKGELRVALAYIHLVVKEGMMLRSLPLKNEETIISRKEQQKRFGLYTIADQQIIATAHLCVVRDWALVSCKLEADCSHLVKITLLHEACYRSERAVVYTTTAAFSEAFLVTNGWKLTVPVDVPEKLRQYKPGVAYWRWEREEQEM